jgi:hypothetical protein
MWVHLEHPRFSGPQNLPKMLRKDPPERSKLQIMLRIQPPLKRGSLHLLPIHPDSEHLGANGDLTEVHMLRKKGDSEHPLTPVTSEGANSIDSSGQALHTASSDRDSTRKANACKVG